MPSSKEKVTSSLRRAIVFALAYQIPILLLSLTTAADGRKLDQICLFVFIFFWLATSVFIWRRRSHPTKFDLFILRVGYLPLLIVTVVLTNKV